MRQLNLLFLLCILSTACTKRLITGEAGDSCTVAQMGTSALISCEDGTSAVVNSGLNGLDGANGTNGTNGTNGVDGQNAVIEIIDPCGDAPGIYDEVLLKLNNKSVVAYLKNSATSEIERLAIVPEGTWSTTDSSGCVFKVDSEGNVSW